MFWDEAKHPRARGKFAHSAGTAKPIVGAVHGRRSYQTTITGKHAAAARATLGRTVRAYRSGDLLPRKYASPQKIREHGRDARIPVREAIDAARREHLQPDMRHQTHMVKQKLGARTRGRPLLKGYKEHAVGRSR